MTFAFYLVSPQKELTRANQKPTSVQLVVSANGRKFKKCTGISVLPADFKKQRTKDERLNDRLRKIENHLNTTLNQFSTNEEIVNAIEDALKIPSGKPVTPRKKKGWEGYKVPTFWQYFDEWADRDVPSKRQRKNIHGLVEKLMGRADNWDAIDTGYYFRLIQRINDAGYSVNYQGSIVSRLKSVMSEGFKLKYHGNSDFHQFTRRSEQPDTIYLTKNELEKLWNLDLNDRMERKVRDLFLLGCYTAMRFSDYSRLSFDNIRDGFIHMTQKKTSSSVVLPASPRVMAILKRNGGAAPKIQQAVFNREIKVVCCKAGMNEAIEVTKSKGAGHISEFKPKYTQVSSHTARRTGCTLMYQSGVPASQVMLISGHKSESAFYRYIRTGKEENAKALADNPFFK